MKKILSLALALVILCLALTSCEVPFIDTPYKLFSNQMEEMKKGYVADMDVTAKVSYGSGSSAVSSSTTVNTKIKQSEDNFDMEMTMNILGIDVSSHVVYLNGTVYVDMGEGSKVSCKIPSNMINKTLNEIGANTTDISEIDIPEEYFKDVKLENKNDTSTFKLTVDGQYFSNFFGNYEESFTTDDIEIGDVKLSFTFNSDKELKNMTISVSIKGKTELVGISQDLTIDLDYDIDFESVGTVSEITAPEGTFNLVDFNDFFTEE